MAPSHESDKPPLTMFSFGKGLFAGGVAGGVSRTAVAPLERLKILMQVQGNRQVYAGMWQGVLRMGHEGGLRELFKGNGTNCLRIVPNSAIKFVSYGEVTRYLSDWKKRHTGDGTLTPFLRLVGGAVAGIIAMSSTYHLDMEGVLALYKGWLPSVIGVVPYAGLNFAVYETCKDIAIKQYHLHGGERDLSAYFKLTAGGLAGLVGQTMAYPFDVVRRRLQVSGWDGYNLHVEGGHAIRYRGMMDCFVRTVQEEGVTALWKGIAPNYAKVVPSIAIAFYVYEWLKDALHVDVRITD